MNHLPLEQSHLDHHAEMAECGAWKVPLHYGAPPDEYASVRQCVGLLDLSDVGVVRVEGTDAPAVLNGILTNDTRVAPGAGCLAALLNDVGRIRAVLHVHRLPHALLLETSPELASTLVEVIDYYVFTEDARAEDVSLAWGLLSVQGPEARSLMEGLLCYEVDLRELNHADATLAEQPVRVVRHSRTGEDGYDIWVPRCGLIRVWEILAAAVDDMGGRRVGREALEMLRLEAGIPIQGRDVDERVNPLEAGILNAVSFDKGCYLGQEVIARISFLSRPARRLVGLLTEPPLAVPVGATIVAEDRDVGWITSAGESPSLGRPVAMGYVRTEIVGRAGRLRIVAGELSVEAEIRELPLVRSSSLAERPLDAVSPPLAEGRRPALPL